MNVTPMIDVLLVLLMIWMVVMATRRRTSPVLLPASAGDALSSDAQRQIVLELTLAGYQVNGQPVPEAKLGDFLRQVYADRPVKLLFVQAAASRTYQEVVAAIDLAKGAGVQLVGLVPGREQ